MNRDNEEVEEQVKGCVEIIINKILEFIFFWIMGILGVEIFKLGFDWDWRCALFCVGVHTLIKSYIRIIKGE